MKPAIEWLDEVGQAAVFSAMVGTNPPGIELEKVIKAVQKDAQKELMEALRVLYEETADYIRLNNLGDIHHNQSMKAARAAIEKAEGKS